MNRKRKEYFTDVEKLIGNETRSICFDELLWRQIHIDILRTDCSQFNSDTAQRCLERILYVWAIRHPASGYVQGMNDILLPLFYVFLTDELNKTKMATNSDINIEDKSTVFKNAEADSYWCLCKLLANIQDNFTSGQSGIFQKIDRFKRIMNKIDHNLMLHLEKEEIDLLSFSFRWINCLLVREFPLDCIVRLWDSYLGEGEDSFSSFHLFVCAAILTRWSEQLKEMNFQDGIAWLQHLPTEQFVESDVEVLISEAFVLQSIYPT